MSIVVDLIIIGIILLSVFLAYKKGLVSLAIGLVSFVIAIAVTIILYKPISNFVINSTNIDETIENIIYEKANETLKKDEKENNEISQIVVESTKNALLPETARVLSVNIVTGGVIVILFILVKLALRFVTSLANLIAKLPIINQINKVGGIIYGLIRGLLIVYIALLLISIIGKINSDNILHKNIENSYIGKTMYENNILNIFFEKN